MLEDILIPIVGCITAIIIVITPQVIKYKLKAEQIKADALVRAEEIRAKNQLEIEKLMQSDRKNSGIEYSSDERSIREKIKD